MIRVTRRQNRIPLIGDVKVRRSIPFPATGIYRKGRVFVL